MAKKSKGSNRLLFVVLIVSAILGLLFTGVKYSNINYLIKINANDWSTFNSSQFSYSFKYPKTYTVYSPTPDGKYEGNLNIVSDTGQINLTLTGTASKQTSISFEEKVKNFQYWDWKNKKSKILTINKQRTFWMTGLENGKKQELYD